MTFLGFCSALFIGASYWWLRSANNTNNFNNVNTSGSNNNNNANNSNGVALGSSLGRQSNRYGEIRSKWREGEQDRPSKTGVNTYFDRLGRTLLAWQRLVVNPLFHAQ